MTNTHFAALAHEAAHLLGQLIRIPSFSREEEEAASFLEKFLSDRGARPRRHGNNIWCEQPLPKDNRPTLLLNAHIDTVRVAKGWRHDPFTPSLEENRLYGLGSNDCGGGLVTLMLTFLRLMNENLPWHIVFLASAEEEVSGRGGIESVLPLLPPANVAIVGEPTGLQPAVAEKGLMVLDCLARGKAGHAARNEGVNAIYEALQSIEWFRSYRFDKNSPLLGEVKMTVTMVQGGSQHNVVPAECNFVVDVRPNELYTNEEVLKIIKESVACEVNARSTRLSSSAISPSHPLVKTAVRLGGKPFGSPTLSDQALMPFPSLKIGPGQSARSHTADEFITLDELAAALRTYDALLRTEP